MRLSPFILSAALVAGTVSAVAPTPAMAAPAKKPVVQKILMGKTSIFRGGKNGPVFSILIDKPSARGFKARRSSSRASRLPIPVDRYDGKTPPLYNASSPDPETGISPWDINKNRPDRAWVRLAWLNPKNPQRELITYEFPIYKSDKTPEKNNRFFPVSIQPGLVMVWQGTTKDRGSTYAHVRIAQDTSQKPCHPQVKIPKKFNMTLPLGPFPPSPISVAGKGKSLKLAGGVQPGSPLFLSVMAENGKCYAGMSVALYPKDNLYIAGGGEIILKKLSVNIVPKGLLGASAGEAELRLLPPK
ncbi:MAG: hypothetical protein WAN89_04000 [Lawsonella sp.]|nr:hypothetical protein [Mycobacteriales bacterium]